MIEPAHCGSNSILTMRFFWDTLYLCLQGKIKMYHLVESLLGRVFGFLLTKAGHCLWLLQRGG